MKKQYIKPVSAIYLVSVDAVMQEIVVTSGGHQEKSDNDDLSKGTGGSSMWEYMDGDDD